jgi:hypothetical protein
MAKELTAQRLRELLHYDPETGVFTWVAMSRPGVRVGDRCGRVSRLGYREIGVEYGLRRANRLAWLYMTGEWPSGDVDHINRDKLDDRWCNLRLATRSQNSANVALRPNSTSGFIGVTFDKARDKWRAQIRIAGRKVNLGRFASAEEAARAYDAAALKEFGEFAELNFGSDNGNTINPDSQGVRPAS